jgi:hypothetical protein
MKAPTGTRRATSRANVQSYFYGANTPQGSALDGVPITWGDRLFYPGEPRRPGPAQPRLNAQGSHHRCPSRVPVSS